MTVSARRIIFSTDLSIRVMAVQGDRVSLALVQGGRDVSRFHQMKVGDKIDIESITATMDIEERDPLKEYWPHITGERTDDA